MLSLQVVHDQGHGAVADCLDQDRACRKKFPNTEVPRIPLIFHLQRRNERRLRDFDAAELAHLFLAGLLLVEQLAFARDVAILGWPLFHSAALIGGWRPDSARLTWSGSWAITSR